MENGCKIVILNFDVLLRKKITEISPIICMPLHLGKMESYPYSYTMLLAYYIIQWLARCYQQVQMVVVYM